jgi:hypothetical protein
LSGNKEAKLTVSFWTTNEVENFCTTDCVSSLSSWKDNVETVCAEETTIQGNVVVKARALPLTFTYNSDLVCMKDGSLDWCFLESQTWQGSDYIRWDPEMCFPDGNDTSTVASQCNDPDFDVSDISSEMAAVTNIYDKELVCKLSTYEVHLCHRGCLLTRRQLVVLQ